MHVFKLNKTECLDLSGHDIFLKERNVKHSGWLHIVKYLILIIVPLFAFGGCLPQVEIQVEKIGFAECIRLDRQPATCDQHDPRFGTYDTGVDEQGKLTRLTAEIYPSSMGKGIPDNLPRSDCLWLGHNEDSWAGGDAIQMTWENILSVNDEDGNPLFGGDNIFGACRFDNAVDRQSPEFEAGSPSEPWVIEVGDNAAFPLAVSSPKDGFQGARPADWPGITRDNNFMFYPLLVEYNNSASDNYGECPPENTHFNDNPLPVVKKPDRIFMCPSTNEGRVQACGLCQLIPVEDASYQLTSNDQLTFPRWMKPNIMVVQGERRIARLMTAGSSNNEYSWSTPLNTKTIGQKTHYNWHENFSSNVIVSRVQFFERASDGTKTPLDDITEAKLFIKYYPSPDYPNPIRYTCTGQSTGNDGMLFNIDRSVSCNFERRGEMVNPSLTPTYDIDLLADERTYNPDSSLRNPLAWQVRFDRGPTNPVYIDFTLSYRTSDRWGLMMKMAVIDFGEVPVDSRRQLYTHGLVTNIGDHPMRIDNITILSHANHISYDAPEGTFTYRLPGKPKPVPLPIDVTTPGDHFASDGTKVKGPMVTLGKDVKDFPLLKVEKGKDCKNRDITLVKPLLGDTALNLFGDTSLSETLDKKTLTAYGEPIEMDGQWAFYKNPKADFESKAKANSADGTERFMATTAYFDRTLPFELHPGESFDVLVKAQPKIVGEVYAGLKVESTSLWDPQRYILPVVTGLRVYGLWGPQLRFIPSILNFPRQYNGNEYWESVVVTNNVGDMDLTRRDISIVGPDASRFSVVTSHAASLILPPGQFEDFRVQYTPRICDDPNDPPPLGLQHKAELKISSDGGEVVVPLRGNAETCRGRPRRIGPSKAMPSSRFSIPPPKMRFMLR